MKKILGSVLDFILNFHIQLILIGIIVYLLTIKTKHDNIFYFDTDFIKTKFALKLAEGKRLNDDEIKERFNEFEKQVKQIGVQVAENGILLSKKSVIHGGVDLTIQICEQLEFSNCNFYE
jgi:hypothetical protein